MDELHSPRCPCERCKGLQARFAAEAELQCAKVVAETRMARLETMASKVIDR